MSGSKNILRALDLFCGAGGVSEGLHRAGFHVVGWDIKRQPRYPFEFHQGDALEAPDDDYDFIWASPPCQAHTSLKGMYNAKPHADLIPATRAKLAATDTPWCMENVMGAPMKAGLVLCGTMFGLGVGDAELRRHRQFELSFHMPIFGLPRCNHGQTVVGIYGGHARNRKRTIGIYGEVARDSRRKFDKGLPDFSVAEARAAMGIDWMTIAELSQAIPPAYSEYIGRAAIAHIQAERQAA